jgi:hypothetical protein
MLERLEPRLPPGDALLALLFASPFASESISEKELTSLHDNARRFEFVDLRNTGITLHSAVPRKSVPLTADIDLVELAVNREAMLDQGLINSALGRSHEVRRLAGARTGHEIATQTAMITSPAVQGAAATIRNYVGPMFRMALRTVPLDGCADGRCGNRYRW